ncbi:N-acyl homoserine lactonase family protein [Desulfohalobium retbaense]|uniref:Beta-lactamase domain protein n=1 Tax=Desulfohalobium retbaense (strain ATCC 49708 / DSM 5692 / JCM 16813 / HR100) TaxID=485915 RepID=C8X1V3_DESRD|nr:N-acyl homoserine lactonase family protein [Desulfohalobium retbaense]ACV68525.1 beta-lactamase domain protein [Desulfohalobium retbaense DSM 5692]
MIYTIHPLVVGSKVFDKGMMTYQHGYGREYTIPIYAWYIQGGEQNILVDTGEMHPIQSAAREEAIQGEILTLEQGLARHNLTPADIDLVLHTHLHTDHCENDAKCSRATIYCHEKELERIHNPHPLDFRYLEDFIEEVEENGQIRTITGDQEIVPGIRVMHTPAHTEGGLSVCIATAAGTAIITGFCVIEENFYPPPEIRGMEMEVIPPGTVVNAYQAYADLCRVKEEADILIPVHEPKFADMRPIPE